MAILWESDSDEVSALLIIKICRRIRSASFDSIDTVKQCLSVFVPMFLGIVVNKSKMYNAAAEGFLNATDCADYLTRKAPPSATPIL